MCWLNLLRTVFRGYSVLLAWSRSYPIYSGGRLVDLRTPQDLSQYFRQEVLDTAELQYAEDVEE